MATIKKRGNGYSVIYSYLNSDGEKKQKWESFSTHAAAKARKITVENDLQEGVFVAPSQLTVSEYLDTFMELYGAKNWALSSYTRNQRIFTNYVIPYMGNKKMQDITPLSIEKYYHELLYSASKVKNKRSNTATTGVIMQIHKSLKCAFHNAERWEIIKKNPFENVTPPKHTYQKRAILTSDEILIALRACNYPQLTIAIHLAFACSLRIGEALGLKWSDIHISDEDIANNDAHIQVSRELSRVSVDAMEKLGKKDIEFVFPPIILKQEHKTRLVLKKPKTDSSIRKIWLPEQLAYLLREWRQDQQKYKDFFGKEYKNYDLVIALEDGRPIARDIISKEFDELLKKAGLPKVVFHSLRHSSTTYKLKLNHGDIKATQGDTGHAQADMVMDVYSHILDEDRKVNAQKFNSEFYKQETDEKSSESRKTELSVDKLMKALQKNPELMRELIDALKQ